MPRINYDALNAQELAVVFNWSLNVDLSGLPEVANIAQTLGLITGGGATDTLNLLCETAGLPETTVTMAEAMVRGMKIKQATNSESGGEISLTFLEKKDYAVSKFFQAWKKFKSNQLTGVVQDKVDSILNDGWSMDLEDNKGIVQDTYDLYYASPTSVALEDPSGEGDFQRVAVTIQYLTYDSGQ